MAAQVVVVVEEPEQTVLALPAKAMTVVMERTLPTSALAVVVVRLLLVEAG